jgi:hypothetical protein
VSGWVFKAWDKLKMIVKNVPILICACLIGLIGCSQTPKQSTRMISDAGMNAEKIIRLPNTAPDAGPTKEAAIRVGKIGQKILASNPTIGIKPSFHTIGSAHAEVFHKGVDQVMITDGLVRECNDDQLAAVLAVELVKMLGEQENSAPTGKIIDRTPGMDVPIGNDRSLVFGPADGIRIAERYELDRMRIKNNSTAIGSVDPKIIARGYLSKAGYSSKSVDSIAGLLKKADENFKLEKTMTGAVKGLDVKNGPLVSQ